MGDVVPPTTGIAELADLAAALVPEEGRSVLGIAGSPGSGKTTLAEALVAELSARLPDGWVAHVPMDGFHLADVQLERLGRRARKGAPDTFDAAGYAALLARLRVETDGEVYAPNFDRRLEQPLAAAMVVPATARLVVTEGNYLLLESPSWERARQSLDEVWFVSTDPGVRVDRLVRRHIEFGKAPDAAAEWVERSDEANARLIEATAHRADRVVLNTPEGWRLPSSARA